MLLFEYVITKMVYFHREQTRTQYLGRVGVFSLENYKVEQMSREVTREKA